MVLKLFVPLHPLSRKILGEQKLFVPLHPLSRKILGEQQKERVL